MRPATTTSRRPPREATEVERYRTLAVLAAVVVGAVVGWLIGGGDVATLRAVLDDPATMDAMTDRQVVGVFLPPIVGAVVVPWAVNRWIEHSPKHDD
jgi:hypothetical protein